MSSGYGVTKLSTWDDLGVHEMDRKVYAVARKPRLFSVGKLMTMAFNAT